MKFKTWQGDWRTSEVVFKLFLNYVSPFSNKSSQGSLTCKRDESTVVLGVKLVASEEKLQKELLTWSKRRFSLPTPLQHTQ